MLINNYALQDMIINKSIKDSETTKDDIHSEDISANDAKDSNNYSGWDFTNTWQIDGNSAYPYPTLRATEELNNLSKSSLTLQVAPTIGGTITGAVSGQYKPGEKITIQVQAEPGYHFVNLKFNDKYINQTNFTFYMPMMPVTLVANYQREYKVTVQANNPNGGTVTGSGNYINHETVTLTATPNTGYRFVNWTDDDG